MIVYIAGKMTGLPDLGKDKFAAAEEMLKAKGHQVLNPAWIGGPLPKRFYMPICLSMLAQADAIYLLDNWYASPGARLERAFAEYQGIKLLTDSELSPSAEDREERDRFDSYYTPEGLPDTVLDVARGITDPDEKRIELMAWMMLALEKCGYGEAVKAIREVLEG